MTRSLGRSMNQSAPAKIRPGVVLLTLVVVAVIYLGTKFVPPYWTYFNMVDPVKTAAMTMVTSRASDDSRARADLIRQAKENDLTLEQENIDISQNAALLTIRVSWVAPVDLPWSHYDLHFQIEERVPLR